MKAKHVLCVVLPLVLAACLVCACVGGPGFALFGGNSSGSSSGSSSESSPKKVFGDFYYTIQGSEGAQTVTIAGYAGTGGAAEIPESIEDLPVRAIAKDAFDKCVSLTSLTIPASVVVIALVFDKAEDAFDGATGLTNITVNEENTVYASEGGILFNKDKTSLLFCPEGKSGSYTIPSSVNRIVYCAFEGCARLASVTIPDSVTSIVQNAFRNCTGLTSITIPGSVKTIGGGTMSEDNLHGAFLGCTGLETVTISEGVTSIGVGAFAFCQNLTSIKIPNSVTYIGGNAFGACSKLTSVTVSPVNGRKWDVEVAGTRTGEGFMAKWVFQSCPLDNASKTALRNAGYPTNEGKF